MALATRHYRIDLSLGIVNEKTTRVNPWKAMRLMRVLFFSEPRRNLASLKPQGLVIFGEHEMLFNPVKVARKLKRVTSSLNTTIIPGTGHSAVYDKPEEVNQVVLHFLTDACTDAESFCEEKN